MDSGRRSRTHLSGSHQIRNEFRDAEAISIIPTQPSRHGRTLLSNIPRLPTKQALHIESSLSSMDDPGSLFRSPSAPDRSAPEFACRLRRIEASGLQCCAFSDSNEGNCSGADRGIRREDGCGQSFYIVKAVTHLAVAEWQRSRNPGQQSGQHSDANMTRMNHARMN
jgi:hypothetical protein